MTDVRLDKKEHNYIRLEEYKLQVSSYITVETVKVNVIA